MKEIKGSMSAKNKTFGLVVSRFNELVSQQLLEGCIDTLLRHGTGDKDISVVWVPGSFEISIIAKKLAETKKFDAVICLGAVIRGDTPHFEYIAQETTKGIAQVGLLTGCPAIYGIITADTIEQALERAGTKQGNKGRQAALDAVEMADLTQKVKFK